MAGYAKTYAHKGAGGAGNKPRYGNFVNLLAQGTLSPAIDTLWAMPFILPEPGILDRLAFKVTTGGGSGNKTRVGIFGNASDTALYPGSLLVGADTGAIDSTGTGVMETTITGGPYLDSGLWWFVLWQGAGTAATYASVAVGGLDVILGVDDTLVGQSGVSASRTYNASGFSTLATPNTFPTGGAYVTGAQPLCTVRLATS